MKTWGLALMMAAGHFGLAGAGHADVTPTPDAAICGAIAAPDAVAIEVFHALNQVYRGRLPGPAGGVALDRSVARLIATHLDFNVFAQRALGPAWDALDPDERLVWTARLSTIIEKRYLDGMGSPLGGRLAVRSVSLDCPDAIVALGVTHRDPHKSKDFEIVMRWGGETWRAVDAIVDEMSLVSLYRGRFVRVFRDGGVAGARSYLDALYRRYAEDGAIVPYEVEP